MPWRIEAAIEAQRLVTTHLIDVAWRDRDRDGEIERDKYERGLGTIWLKDASGERLATLYARLVGPVLALPCEAPAAAPTVVSLYET